MILYLKSNCSVASCIARQRIIQEYLTRWAGLAASCNSSLLITSRRGGGKRGRMSVRERGIKHPARNLSYTTPPSPVLSERHQIGCSQKGSLPPSWPKRCDALLGLNRRWLLALFLFSPYTLVSCLPNSEKPSQPVAGKSRKSACGSYTTGSL